MKNAFHSPLRSFVKKIDMPHINVDKNLPGIRSLMAFSPETATPMGELANLLLRSNNDLNANAII
jgi:hypothetical protein